MVSCVAKKIKLNENPKKVRINTHSVRRTTRRLHQKPGKLISIKPGEMKSAFSPDLNRDIIALASP